MVYLLFIFYYINYYFYHTNSLIKKIYKLILFYKLMYNYILLIIFKNFVFPNKNYF